MLYLTFFEQTIEKKYQNEHRAGLQLLQYALKEEYGINKIPRIERKKYGKPYFPEYQQIHFNISHTAGIAICAIGMSELGVDIERVRYIKDTMAKRIFTEKERMWLQRQEKKEEASIRLWTLKESYVKTTGQGLSTEFTKIEFTFPDSVVEKITSNKKGYSFFQQKIRKDAYLALCIKNIEIPLEMKKMHIIF